MKGCGEDCVECQVADEMFHHGDVDATEWFLGGFPSGWPSWMEDVGVCC